MTPLARLEPGWAEVALALAFEHLHDEGLRVVYRLDLLLRLSIHFPVYVAILKLSSEKRKQTVVKL